MPDDFDIEDDTDPDEDLDDSNPMKAMRRQIRQGSKREKELQAELEAAAADRKELAFFKADIPDTKMGAFFRNNYSGDLTAEAIRLAAQEVGLIDEQASVHDPSIAKIDGMSQAAGAGQMASAPGADSEMWAEASAAAAAAGANAPQAIAEVLRRYGHNTGGVGTEMINGAPSTVPLSQNPAGRI